MKKLIIKLLIRTKILTRSTEVWVLAYSIGDDDIHVETYFTELEAVNRRTRLWDRAIAKGQQFNAILNKYSGVDTSKPITFEGTL